MKEQELIALASKAENRVLGWIEQGLVPADPAYGVCDVLALLRDRVRESSAAREAEAADSSRSTSG